MMHFTEMKLKNFKLFKTAHVKFRPLTLLTGTNSAGKSTILHALAGILQTQQPHLFPFEFTPSGRNCSLGSYKDIVYGNNTRTKFAVELLLHHEGRNVSLSGQYRYSSEGNQILPDYIVFNYDRDSIELDWKDPEGVYRALVKSESHNRLLVNTWLLNVKDALEPVLEQARQLRQAQGNGPVLDEIRNVENLFRSQPNEWFTLTNSDMPSILAELSQQPGGTSVLSSLTDVLQDLGSNCAYIGPVRVYPSRYYLTEGIDSTIDPMGKNAVSVLFDWRKHQREKYDDVIELLQLLELASKVTSSSELTDILKLDIQPYQHRETVNFADVGFGVSQILPVLISDVALPQQGTLLVNQPEVHLHPSSQALLANYFTSRLNKRNYVIETHSEYLINRLRLLAVQGKIDTNDIAIVFIEASRDFPKSPQIHHIMLGNDGSLMNAPKSFFQTYYLDSFNIAMGELN